MISKVSQLILLVFICSFCTNTSTLIAQQYSSGLIFDEEAFENAPVIPEVEIKGGEMDLFASLKQYAPEVANQGKISSCVGWAVGYANMTMLYAKLKGIKNKDEITANAFSAMYLYNNIYRDECQSGATLEDAGTFLSKNGNYLSTAFDPLASNCTESASIEFQTAALDFKINGFFRVYANQDTPNKKILKIKQSISKGYPVVVGINLLQNFYDPKGKYWDPNKGNTLNTKKHHAVVIVGYDERKGVFELMNSWGKSWGNEGFIFVKYEDLEANMCSAYRFVLDKKVQLPNRNNEIMNIPTGIHYEGYFEFGLFWNDNDSEWEHFELNHEKDYSYTTVKENWEEGDYYQLRMAKMQVNHAVYIFSLDKKGVNIHWPRTKHFNNEYKRYNETAVVPYGDVSLVIPHKEGLLYNQGAGTDHIFIIISTNVIHDFLKRINLMEAAANESIEKRFEIGFGDLIVPIEDLDYQKENLGVAGNSYSNKSLVPILLKVLSRQ